MVENQQDNRTLEINDCNFKQTVYVYNCKNVVLQINSKVNSICIDKCTRTAVVFTDVVAACEIVNGSSIEVQVKGVVPTVAVDNTAGVQIYLSRASLGAPPGPPGPPNSLPPPQPRLQASKPPGRPRGPCSCASSPSSRTRRLTAAPAAPRPQRRQSRRPSRPR